MPENKSNIEDIKVLKAENQELKDRNVELEVALIQVGQRALNAEAQILSIQRTNLRPQLEELQTRLRRHEAKERS